MIHKRPKVLLYLLHTLADVQSIIKRTRFSTGFGGARESTARLRGAAHGRGLVIVRAKSTGQDNRLQVDMLTVAEGTFIHFTAKQAYGS